MIITHLLTAFCFNSSVIKIFYICSVFFLHYMAVIVAEQIVSVQFYTEFAHSMYFSRQLGLWYSALLLYLAANQHTFVCMVLVSCKSVISYEMCIFFSA